MVKVNGEGSLGQGNQARMESGRVRNLNTGKNEMI